MRVEVNAQINRDIIGAELGISRLPPGVNARTIQDNYSEIANRIKGNLLRNGQNGLGQTPEEAYGAQYDRIRLNGSLKFVAPTVSDTDPDPFAEKLP
ncbi:hypothetical protein D3C71_899820 [compost metagenome]